MGQEPLHIAALHGHKDAGICLLRAEADFDAVDSYRKRPLHYASEGGHENIVGCLLKAGAETDAESKSGKLPLHYAVEYATKIGEGQKVKLLLEKEAGVDRENSSGQYNESRAIRLIKLLLYREGATNLSRKAEINRKDKDGKTPADYATKICTTKSYATKNYVRKKKLGGGQQINFKAASSVSNHLTNSNITKINKKDDKAVTYM